MKQQVRFFAKISLKRALTFKELKYMLFLQATLL